MSREKRSRSWIPRAVATQTFQGIRHLFFSFRFFFQAPPPSPPANDPKAWQNAVSFLLAKAARLPDIRTLGFWPRRISHWGSLCGKNWLSIYYSSFHFRVHYPRDNHNIYPIILVVSTFFSIIPIQSQFIPYCRIVVAIFFSIIPYI